MISTKGRVLEYRIAVYGSLKAGRHNHRYLETARFIGRFHTTPDYTMIDLGPYPAIIPDGSTAIEVEVYAVDAETLGAVDELEEHPDFYRRIRVKIANRYVFIYVLTERGIRGIKNPRRRIIESGRW
ncbi:MAG: gamma-glutamylcyclotransferase family protein [Methylococcales bacterium]